MSEWLTRLEKMVAAYLSTEPQVTPTLIRDLIDNVRRMPGMAGVNDEQAERLAREFEVRLGVTMNIGAVLTAAEYKPWLEAAKVDIDPYYWERYKTHLLQKNFPPQVVSKMDQVTDTILGLLENPNREGSWDRRGMVLGHVQSGKTANYTGVICKAADAGYKVIIIIAGLHNNLRNQTQARIDEGFLGWDSSRLLHVNTSGRVGVGLLDARRKPSSLTTSLKDFNKAAATQANVPLQNMAGEPAVFVIKKNSSTLKNLLEWLRENRRAGSEEVESPMLMIDDEADNASINISHGKGEVSTINGQIRSLLKMFQRSCYVGYTATPFANIFIDPDSDDEMRGADLFPRDFIVSLDPPSNYFGPDRVFGDEADGAEQRTVIRHIEDNEDVLPLKHRIDAVVGDLPESLLNAVRTFVVARAIRLSRGQSGEHSSMLVNVSRFTNVQRQLRNEIHHALREIQTAVRVNGAKPLSEAMRDSEITNLHEQWRREYQDVASWEVLQPLLHEAAAPISVVEINSKSSGSLDYSGHRSAGLNVIAVGGFSLSRGLTLEGLTVSYFLRNSMMYDTLMQMGRWFGYRPGYDDLCRVWMTEEADGWYGHISESIELLRKELRTMEAAGATPVEFGLKVRSHPQALIVTARNKMGTGEHVRVRIDLAKSFQETTLLKGDPAALDKNREAVRNLASDLEGAGYPLQRASSITGGFLVSECPVQPVLNFLSSFQNHEGSVLTDGDPISRYIERRRHDELSRWDIFFPSIQSGDATFVVSDLGVPINCQRRTADTKGRPSTIRVTSRHRVASRGAERAGLTLSEIEQAHQRFRKEYRQEKGKEFEGSYPDRCYREVRRKPLLIVHLLRVDDTKKGRALIDTFVVAWSLGFPDTQIPEEKVEYVVNTTWLRENFRDEAEEEEMAGDDE